MNCRPLDAIEIAAARACVAPDAPALAAAWSAVPARSRRAGVLLPAARLLLASAQPALPPSRGVDSREPLDRRFGVSLGTQGGALAIARRSLLAAQAQGAAGLVPSWYATGLANASAATLASACGLGGPNLSFLGSHAGVEALLHACRCLLRGRADTMLAGGFDLAFAPQPRSAEEAAEPTGGAAALLLLRRAAPGRPQAPGTRPGARVVGWSECLDGSHHASPPDARAAALLRAALPAGHARAELAICTADPVLQAAAAPLRVVRHVQAGRGLLAIVALGPRSGHCVVVDAGRPEPAT